MKYQNEAKTVYGIGHPDKLTYATCAYDIKHGKWPFFIVTLAQ